jgi:hypothetical protein
MVIVTEVSYGYGDYLNRQTQFPVLSSLTFLAYPSFLTNVDCGIVSYGEEIV